MLAKTDMLILVDQWINHLGKIIRFCYNSFYMLTHKDSFLMSAGDSKTNCSFPGVYKWLDLPFPSVISAIHALPEHLAN